MESDIDPMILYFKVSILNGTGVTRGSQEVQEISSSTSPAKSREKMHMYNKYLSQGEKRECMSKL